MWDDDRSGEVAACCILMCAWNLQHQVSASGCDVAVLIGWEQSRITIVFAHAYDAPIIMNFKIKTCFMVVKATKERKFMHNNFVFIWDKEWCVAYVAAVAQGSDAVNK